MGIHGLAQATGWPHNVALFANWTRRSERGTFSASGATATRSASIAGRRWPDSCSAGSAWPGPSSARASCCFASPVFRPFTRRNGRNRWAYPSRKCGTRRRSPARGEGAAPSLRCLPASLASIVAMGLIYIGLRFLRYALDSWSTLILGEQFEHDDFGRRLPGPRLSTGSGSQGIARRRLLVRPPPGFAAHAGHFLDDRRLPRLHRRCGLSACPRLCCSSRCWA